MTWNNSDNLYVKFGREQGQVTKGGEYSTLGSLRVSEYQIDWTDALSATAAIVAGVSNASDTGAVSGTAGLLIPEGARIEAVEIVVEEAFTSSGTVSSATLVMGLIKASDRTTALNVAGFTTTSFTAGALDAVGERTYITAGTTGAGAFITSDAAISEAGYLCVANSAHASHPFTAGSAKVRIYWNTRSSTI